jgi:hypothetical protein
VNGLLGAFVFVFGLELKVLLGTEPGEGRPGRLVPKPRLVLELAVELRARLELLRLTNQVGI